MDKSAPGSASHPEANSLAFLSFFLLYHERLLTTPKVIPKETRQKIKPYLGKQDDRKIARRFGLSTSFVQGMRSSLNILPFKVKWGDARLNRKLGSLIKGYSRLPLGDIIKRYDRANEMIREISAQVAPLSKNNPRRDALLNKMLKPLLVRDACLSCLPQGLRAKNFNKQYKHVPLGEVAETLQGK